MWRKPFAAVDKTVGEVEVLHLTRATLDSRVVELAMFEGRRSVTQQSCSGFGGFIAT